MNLGKVNWCFQPMKLWNEPINKNRVLNPFTGKSNGQIIFSIWEKLEKYQTDAQKIGIRQTILIGTESDVFGSRIYLHNKQLQRLNVDSSLVRGELFKNISAGKYPNLIFLFLTNHPGEITKCILKEWLSAVPGNIMFGVSGNSQKEIEDNFSSLSTAPGDKFIYIKPEYTNLTLNEILYGGRIELVIQGDNFESDNEIVDIESLRKVKNATEKAEIRYYFKHDHLLTSKFE